MGLLELPPELFLSIIEFAVHELGVCASMRTRLVCRVFAAEIPEALHRTRVIEEAVPFYYASKIPEVVQRYRSGKYYNSWNYQLSDKPIPYGYKSIRDILPQMLLIKHHPEVLARYFLYRVRTDRRGNIHPIVETIRQTVKEIARYYELDLNQEPEKAATLYQAACSCLALYRNQGVLLAFRGFPETGKEEEDEEEDGAGEKKGIFDDFRNAVPGNCLTVAAWLGDMDLIKEIELDAYNNPGDSTNDPSLFGRPLWAAAAQGHLEVVNHFLDRGDRDYGVVHARSGWDIFFGIDKLAVGVAAYMGRGSVVQALQQAQTLRQEEYLQHHSFWQLKDHEERAIVCAVQGNQPELLSLLLDRYKEGPWHSEYPGWEFTCSLTSFCLVISCKLGLHRPASVLLQHNANTLDTDFTPLSFLELAAISGNATLVKILLDAGAGLEPAKTTRGFTLKWQRDISFSRRKRKSALAEARYRGHREVERLIVEKMDELQLETMTCLATLFNDA
ncbi:uncharacterized protein K452DRAFT_313572 [Aplosporella prunicola CBS 121167]|uniref:Uncharacterized protein n=1 Tax=Aplosporella prunicola CBS 121167 TaxID=1176127 RepID=A0A6A6AYZ1_9PEZI|nr:uncharacterized protein K452DRAFT_313572 [Aplosporella prunicola CBS 121167]KAF2135987.1 hypothetical protein K452DRAFT_313572 [Aplosporella prunicola CBS 121167]